MARKTEEERLIELQKKMSQLREKEARLKRRKAERDRKADTRRKVILGGLVLRWLRTDARPELRSEIRDAISSMQDRDKSAFNGWDLPQPDGNHSTD